MKLYATIEEFQTFNKVKYYTIRYEYEDDLVDEDSETDKFFKHFLVEPENPTESARNIFQLLEEIGERGAFKRYFRFENNADALPPRNKFLHELGFGDANEPSLRLYCIRLSDSLVILLNGGEKTSNTVQNCPNVSHHFRMACKLASLIDEAIQGSDIFLYDRDLQFEEEFVLHL